MSANNKSLFLPSDRKTDVHGAP